ncbi:PaaI family thioesterase [Roseomonas sp. NAR14]|uniref:PaaI family thioesterase n=1 Tax=Roseomonas acroporae TaxID=2937791 RepID=A0A9X2BXP7_9PROT|nr:PaaI family thioesterase [Roseomonas acroporae]MCK8786179.1 PaaI family thioesterase [Roseomonas acroporae]
MDPQIDPSMDPKTLSGFELLSAAAAGRLPRAPIAATMGLLGMVVEKGRVEMRARADERHLNPLGGVHGGFAATVLDSVTGCAVHTMLEAGIGYGTVDLGVKMLRPVPLGEELVAEARVTHLSRSLGVAEGTLRDAAGNLLASASATCFIRRPRA